MALKKPIEVDSCHVMAEYWRITEVPPMSLKTYTGGILLEGYKDKEARDSGANPIPSAQYRIHIDKNNFISMINEPVTQGNTR